MEDYRPFFPGFDLAPVARAACAVSRGVEGSRSGRTCRVICSRQ